MAAATEKEKESTTRGPSSRWSIPRRVALLRQVSDAGALAFNTFKDGKKSDSADGVITQKQVWTNPDNGILTLLMKADVMKDLEQPLPAYGSVIASVKNWVSALKHLYTLGMEQREPVDIDDPVDTTDTKSEKPLSEKKPPWGATGPLASTTKIFAKQEWALRQTTLDKVINFFAGVKKEDAKRGENDIDKYNKMHDHHGGDSEARKKGYTDLVNSYYNLATDFYEIGWGQSFHFANRFSDETHASSIVRHEYYLAARLGIQPTDHVLDCGCGIGGPLRNLGRFTGASITGVTLNQYQVDRGNQLCVDAQLAPRCKLVQADFHKLPFADNTFDHVYSIEACCHSPDRADVYREIYRVLKPGGMFVSYEWCLTKKHNPNDPVHIKSKRLIEEGDGLPDLMPTEHCDESLVKVGFEVIEARDAAHDNNPGGEPWYTILTPSFSPLQPFRMQFTWIGTFIINLFLNFLELIGLAPKGSGKVREMLRQGQLGLVMGGKMDTFTPMYFVHAKKK